jgi:hypothetical protein
VAADGGGVELAVGETGELGGHLLVLDHRRDLVDAALQPTLVDDRRADSLAAWINLNCDAGSEALAVAPNAEAQRDQRTREGSKLLAVSRMPPAAITGDDRTHVQSRALRGRRR